MSARIGSLSAGARVRFNMHRFVASGFYVGLIPHRLWGSDKGAGTFGAAVAVVISILLWRYPWWLGVIAFAVAFVLSLWSARPFAADHADPGWIVIDEIAGTLIAVIGLTGWPWLVAVVVARLADIFKVLPGVGQAESLPGAVGITMDDVVAGLYGLAAGWVTVLLV
ncbi:MAG: phosphatidylglycerophosphatase A [Actinomycetota bacterium]|nr:phosphatidylglycerophosphatase A [Actinomycetota bacterium]